MSPKHVTAILLCTICMTAGSVAADAPAAAGRKFLTAFRDCQARHDAVACSALIADDAMLYSDKGEASDKDAFLHDVADKAKPKPGDVVRQFSEPEGTSGWRVGDLLFFNYRSTRSETYGTQPYHIEYRATLVLRETGSGSKLQLFQATPIPNSLRSPAKVDPATYDAYVGEYSAGADDHEVVTREGSQLVLTLNGARTLLKPGEANSFYLQGEADDWFFIRDAQGRVTGLESRLWGQNILAKRLP